MAGSNTNMEVIILSLTIYTLAHHPQWLTRREEAVREEQKFSDSELSSVMRCHY